MIEKKFKIDSTIRAKAELTCQYESEFSPRKCIVALEQEVNLNSIHDIMCCDHPVKTINVEEGWTCRHCWRPGRETAFKVLPVTCR